MDLLKSSVSREAVAQQLHSLRDAGDLLGAIALCGEAATLFPNDYFYPQIASDLHYRMQEYNAAAEALAQCLGKLPPGATRFARFAQRYNRLIRAGTAADRHKWAAQIIAETERPSFDAETRILCARLVQLDLSRRTEISEKGQRLLGLLSNDANFNKFVEESKSLQSTDSPELEYVLDIHVLDRKRTRQTYRIDVHCISLYERMECFDSALKVAMELLGIGVSSAGVVVRSVFRICRHIDDYSKADELLAEYPSVLKVRDFNVLYELVYYFEHQDNFEQAQATLIKMEKGFADNPPILKTVKNFYTRFGLVEDVARVSNRIEELREAGQKEDTRFQPAVEESEAAVPSEIHDLRSKLEHQTRLAAISDLTTGISHELGQPITNIRYTVQFYRRMLDRKYTKETVCSAFDSILEETERMGGLMKRLSPLTSSRSIIEEFDIVERIHSRVRAERARLTRSKIEVKVSPNKSVLMLADPVKFDQLVGNLLLNAIDAINERKTTGPRRIRIHIYERDDEISILFENTGVEIPLRDRGKLFDPFFTTKAPGKGEGLGLFIVWNLLKMQGGKITLDPAYKNGARFFITLPRTTEANKEL